MPKIWLTYAWKDNQDADVDFVIQQLKGAGIEVGFDRAHLVPGQRLWPQLDKAISDPTTDAWAIFATKNSFSSEPCLEEIAYALDRALRQRGAEFPLIGIFPEPLDRSLIPSAIATRIYVSLQETDWVAKVVAGVQKQAPKVGLNVPPLVAVLHRQPEGKYALEVRPRAGRWFPCFVAMRTDAANRFTLALPGPAGRPTGSGMVSSSEASTDDGAWTGRCLNHAIDAPNSLYLYFDGKPTGELKVGAEEEMYSLSLDTVPVRG